MQEVLEKVTEAREALGPPIPEGRHVPGEPPGTEKARKILAELEAKLKDELGSSAATPATHAGTAAPATPETPAAAAAAAPAAPPAHQPETPAAPATHTP